MQHRLFRLGMMAVAAAVTMPVAFALDVGIDP
jgi:hypothetical protein